MFIPKFKRIDLINFTNFLPSVNLQSHNRCSLKKKFHKMPGPQACKIRGSLFYCEFCKISKNTFFTEDLWATASELVTEMLIFTRCRSQMLFKISVLKNFAVIMEPLSNIKVTGLLLQNTYGSCF